MQTFETDLIALDTSTDTKEPAFIVSHLWWLYFAFVLLLTVFTMVRFLLCRRFREENAAGKGPNRQGI